MKKQIKLATTYINKGITTSLNVVGLYRICEEPNCKRYIPCPYVRCQDHRTDFALKDNTVNHLEPEEVEIIS